MRRGGCCAGFVAFDALTRSRTLARSCASGFVVCRVVVWIGLRLRAMAFLGMADPDVSETRLYMYAGLMSGLTFFRVFFLHCGALQQWFSGMEIRAAAIGVLFRKVHSLRAENLSSIPSGQLISLMSADVERFIMVWFLHSVWLSPLLVAAVIAIGYQQIGWSILAGVGVWSVLLPTQLFFGRVFARLRRKTAGFTDKRVGAMKDILHGIRGVKAAAWETPFAVVIAGLRKAETEHLLKTAYIKCSDFTLTSPLLFHSLPPTPFPRRSRVAHIALLEIPC